MNWIHVTLPFDGESVAIRTVDLIGVAGLVAGIVIAGMAIL